VHFLRNVEARVPKTAQPMVGAAVRTIFQQETRAAAQEQLCTVCESLREKFPAVIEILALAEEEILTFYDFPPAHWRQIYSTNPYERLNKELKRRSAVVGIFPDRASVIRLLGAVLAEQNDEWLVGRRHFSEESMQALLRPRDRAAEQLPLEVSVAQLPGGVRGLLEK
jgi:putative transposase